MTLSNKFIYLDNNATTKPLKEAVEAANLAFDTEYGNPSAYHQNGLNASYLIETARLEAANLIGAAQGEIIFTGSGTESNNLAITGTINYFKYILGKNKMNIITTRFEHHSVLNTIEKACAYYGVEVRYLSCNPDYSINHEELYGLIDENTVLVSVMLANNEVGAVAPFNEIGGICSSKGILFHADAVCATGKIRYDVKKIKCDLLSVSAHKIYGLKGAGFLYKKRGVEVMPIMWGGGQEAGLRPGTENVGAVFALGKCCAYFNANLENLAVKCQNLRNLFINEIKAKIPNAIINCESSRYGVLPNTISVIFDFKNIHEINGFIFNIDLMGVCISQGSACSAMMKEPSHVLKAAGFDDLKSRSGIRVSIGLYNTEDEMLLAAEVLRNAYQNVVLARKDGEV